MNDFAPNFDDSNYDDSSSYFHESIFGESSRPSERHLVWASWRAERHQSPRDVIRSGWRSASCYASVGNLPGGGPPLACPATPGLSRLACVMPVDAFSSHPRLPVDLHR